MKTYNYRFETIVGILLLVIAVLGFMWMLVARVPKSDEVKAQAKTLKSIPEDFFNNALTKQVQSLEVPNGVPVVLDQGNVGRSNIFESY